MIKFNLFLIALDFFVYLIVLLRQNKDALLDLRQILATGSLLKMIKNNFYFTSDFIVRLPLLCEILGIICIAIVCKPGCEVMDFVVNLTFLIEPFFRHNRKVVTKT